MFEALSAVPLEQVQPVAQAADVWLRGLASAGQDGIAAAYTTPTGGGGCETYSAIITKNVRGEVIDYEIHCIER
jgi:hypothetical protein